MYIDAIVSDRVNFLVLWWTFEILYYLSFRCAEIQVLYVVLAIISNNVHINYERVNVGKKSLFKVG